MEQTLIMALPFQGQMQMRHIARAVVMPHALWTHVKVLTAEQMVHVQMVPVLVLMVGVELNVRIPM
jgi:hypothetical protein